MSKDGLALERLLEVVSYDPASGKFVWIKQIGKRAKPCSVAGTVDADGYVVITIDKRRHKAHRIAWLASYGTWPAVAIDHINGDRTDNRLSNLREADWGENQQNRGIQSNNKSGRTGVSWDAHAAKWRAGIRFKGVSRNLGSYDSVEAAHAAYLKAKAELHRFQPVPRNG